MLQTATKKAALPEQSGKTAFSSVDDLLVEGPLRAGAPSLPRPPSGRLSIGPQYDVRERPPARANRTRLAPESAGPTASSTALQPSTNQRPHRLKFFFQVRRVPDIGPGGRENCAKGVGQKVKEKGPRNRPCGLGLLLFGDEPTGPRSGQVSSAGEDARPA